MRSVRMRSGENPNGRKLQGTGVYATNLAADICLAKMVAGLLSHPKRQFYPSENNRHSFYLSSLLKECPIMKL